VGYLHFFASAGALLHLRPFETHARADERGHELVVLIAVLLPQIILDATSTEVDLDRPFEAVEEHTSRTPVTHADGSMKGNFRIGVEASEASPTKLDRTQAGKDEARRRDQRPVRRTRRVRRVRPQRIVVADAFRKAQNRQPRRVLVVDAVMGAQLGANERAHLLQHIISEFPVREFGRDACGVVHVDGILLDHVNDMSAYVRYYELLIVFMKINYTDNVARVKGLFFRDENYLHGRLENANEYDLAHHQVANRRHGLKCSDSHF
jgi:hypothetical protein